MSDSLSIFKKVSVLTFDYFSGDHATALPDGEHLFGLAPAYPTTVPMSFDHGKTVDIEWPANSLGYTPSGERIDAVMLQDANTTWVTIPDAVFKTCAYETFDNKKFEFRGIRTTDDQVTRNLVLSMRTAAGMLDSADFAQIADPIGNALALRTLQQLGATHRNDAPYPGGLPPERLRMVIEYIDANLSKSIRLSELAGVAMLSEFHFSRAFKQATNVAPIRYLWQRRVERAKDALRRTRAPLVAIAYECGFSSQSHFTTAFKQAAGLTPAAFRAAVLAWASWALMDLFELAEVLQALLEG